MGLTIKLVATDLDGTLLKDDKTISKVDINTLEILGNENIVRVVATGRSMHSVQKVLHENFPVDYIIFSTGCGIYDWKNKKLLFSAGLKSDEIQFAVKTFVEERLDFTVHYPVPNNHRFVYYINGNRNPDFENYCLHFAEFAAPWDKKLNSLNEGAQLLSIMPHDLERYCWIKDRLANFKVVRTTSPQNHQNIWIEVFNSSVSKGNSLAKLCQDLKIDRENTFSIGNDFNDIELLDFTRYSFVVANAHDDLKDKYNTTYSNQEDGFSRAIFGILL